MAVRTRLGFIGSMAAYLGFAAKATGAGAPRVVTDAVGVLKFPRSLGHGTFADLKTEVFRRLHESATAPVFWTEDDVEVALNEGYAELSDATEWYEQSIVLDLLNNRPYYDLFSMIGPDFLSVKPIFDESSNRWLGPVALRELDSRDRRWERVTGLPQRVLLRGLRWLGLYPRVQSDTGQVTVYYTALPPPLVEDEDEPLFPEAYHEGLIAYALADLWAQDAEVALALEAWADYLVVESALEAWVQHRAAIPMTTGIGWGGGRR